MRRIIPLFVFFLILKMTCFSQSIIPYQEIFVNNYRGKTLKYINDERFSLVNKLYKSFDDINAKKVVFPSDKNDWETKKDSLVGHDFKVINIFEFDGSLFKRTNSKETRVYLQLLDLQRRDTLLLKYFDDSEYNFPFIAYGDMNTVLTESEILSEKINDRIKIYSDEFTGNVSISSPESLKLSDPDEYSTIGLTKIKSKNKISYFLRLNTSGITLNYDAVGVIVLFTDGSKWQKSNAKINVESGSGKYWNYRAFINLNNSDLEYFKSKKVKKFRLYIHDHEIDPEESSVFRYSVKQIINKKL